VIMEYETNSVEALEKYAIVQFKKGCVFSTSKNAEGKTTRTIDNTVVSFGKSVPFCFRQWVIDSQDSDPVYNSDSELGRFYYLRWNDPGSYDERTEKYSGAEKPKVPAVYMTDYPIGAFVGRSSVKNVALEYKTCIYKTADVPKKTLRDRIKFAQPI